MIDSSRYEVIEHHDVADLVLDRHTGMKGLISNVHFSTGETVSDFSSSSVVAKPDYLTVQLDEGQHIKLQPEYLQYMNHSCDPNMVVDTELCRIVALKIIRPGDELTFFYPSTEWKMDRPFQCNCGSAQCIGMVEGAFALTDEQRSRYAFSPFIQKKFQES